MSQGQRPYRYTKGSEPPAREVILLYVEGELPPEEQAEVERFLVDHPPYAEAVEGLSGKRPPGISDPDDDGSHKSSGQKREGVHYMPFDIDKSSKHERSPTSGQEESFHRQSVRSDVEQLNQKIDIISAHEEKGRRKPIKIEVWRYAAAALLIVFLGLSGWLLTMQLNQLPPDVLSEKQTEKQTPKGPITGDDKVENGDGHNDQQAILKPLEEGGKEKENAQAEEDQEEQATSQKKKETKSKEATRNKAQSEETTNKKPGANEEGNTSKLTDQLAETDAGQDSEEPSAIVDSEQNRADESNNKRQQRIRQPGSANGQAGNEQQADLAGAKNVQPQNDQVEELVQKGVQQFEQQQYQGCYQTMLQVIQQRPEHLKARYYAGMTAFELENYSTALEHFNYLVGPEPQHIYFEDALWYLGQTHLQNGDTAKARKALQRIQTNQYERYKKATEQLEQLGK